MEVKKCLNCGAEFSPKFKRTKGKIKIYCSRACSVQFGCLRRNPNYRPWVEQVPGNLYTFYNRQGEEDTGVLPDSLGLQNDFAFWYPNVNFSNGGYWCSKALKNKRVRRIRKGEGPKGLLGRMSLLLLSSRKVAKKDNHLPISVTPEYLLQMWLAQENKCAACGSVVELLKATLDHNHETGQPRGFIHGRCNLAEGHVATMTKPEFENWVTYIRGICYAG